jgi:transcriptional regulator with XRE-family HTH domain
MPDNLHVGSRMKVLINNSNLSVKEISEKMGISPPNIYRLYERESVETKYLVKLSEIFEIPISYFFSDIDTRELESEIIGIKRKLELKEEEVISLKEKNEMLGKLLELKEAQLEKRVESNNFLASLFNVLDDPKYKDFGDNISVRLFTLAKDLLREGDVNAYMLVSKISNDREMVNLIELANKKMPRSI